MDLDSELHLMAYAKHMLYIEDNPGAVDAELILDERDKEMLERIRNGSR